MSYRDYMVRAAAADERVRAFAITSKNIVETARKAHNTSPEVTAALGRTLSAAAMMGYMMKEPDDLLTIQIQGDGPMKGLTVTADSHGHVKGFPRVPVATMPPKNGKLNVGGAVGKGTLTVMKDLGLKKPYSGVVPLRSGEIADDITYYFAASEQTPSSVGLGVLLTNDNTVDVAGGFIVQLMPDCPEDVIEVIEKNVSSVNSVTDLLKEGMTPEDLIETVLSGLDITMNESHSAEFRCDCSRERVMKSILSIGEKDLNELISDGEPVEVKCSFCGTNYVFETGELEEAVKAAKA